MVICRHCGKEFYVLPGVLAAGKGKYCSKSCASIARYKDTPPELRDGRENKICEYCGKTFKVYKSNLERDKGKYCSRSCSKRVLRIDLPTDEIISRYVIGQESIKTIASEYGVSQIAIARRLVDGAARIRKPTEQTESRHIKSSVAKRGKNNGAWRGGVTEIKYCFKFNNRFREHIRDKFERKCYICHVVESKNRKKLSVHHVDYNKNSICNGKEWAFVPLCGKCHAKSNNNRHYYFNLLINYWAMNPAIHWGVFI